MLWYLVWATYTHESSKGIQHFPTNLCMPLNTNIYPQVEKRYRILLHLAILQWELPLNLICCRKKYSKICKPLNWSTWLCIINLMTTTHDALLNVKTQQRKVNRTQKKMTLCRFKILCLLFNFLWHAFMFSLTFAQQHT